MENKEHIFISYRRKDKNNDDAFESFVRTIEACTGLDAFWDLEGLRSGAFADVLRQKVASAYVFMPIVTDNYLAFGQQGAREDDKDYCLMEYETAILHHVKIVPLFFCPEGDKHTPNEAAVLDAARRTSSGRYDQPSIAILQKYLLSQNGVHPTAPTRDALLPLGNQLGTLVFDEFCRSDRVPYYKEVLQKQNARWNPIRILGDFDDSGLTLANSYIPLRFLRHLSQAELAEKEKRSDSLEPVDQTEQDLLAALAADRYAVVVGDAGQGKSSFVRHLVIDLGDRAQGYGLSRDLYYPLYYECKQFDASLLDNGEAFLNILAEWGGLSRSALNAILRRGKPLVVFDAMDEVAPNQMDKLMAAIHAFLTANHPNVYCLFATRPGQKLVAAGDMTLAHTDDTLVRRYTIQPFNKAQRDAYVGRLAQAKGVAPTVKAQFLTEVDDKEQESTYLAVSRNPFVLLTVFTDYIGGGKLPDNRFDAICRVIDNTIVRDLGKDAEEESRAITSNDIKVILGAISYQLYRQRDEGERPIVTAQMPVEFAEAIYDLDKTNRSDRAILQEYKHFFDTSKLFDINGFRHEFLAATYAAYYLQFALKHPHVAEPDAMAVLAHDTDYWKSVTEALLCLLDRTSRDSKLYIEPLLEKLQENTTPDYDTLCGAVAQFTRHRARGALVLLSGMLCRGCAGILHGEPTKTGFVCPQGINPYEELFYFPAIYPALQPYLPNLPTLDGADEQAYLHNELRKEVCALFGDNAATELGALYAERGKTDHAINLKLQRAAFRKGRLIRGYVRITKSISSLDFARCHKLTAVTISAEVTSIQWNAFRHCSGLSALLIADGNPVYHSDGNCIIETRTNTLVVGCKTSMISAYVTTIGRGAFYGCRALTAIAIPDSVTTIERRAFFGCSGLASIFIGERIVSIEEAAFFGCSELSSFVVAENNPAYFSDGNCLIQKNDNALIAGCKSSTIPSYVTSIEDLAFGGCSGLTAITIPSSVIRINSGAFYGCSGLTAITIPAGVTFIGENAFSWCNGLSSFVVAENNPAYFSDGNCIIQTCTNVLVQGCNTSVIPSYVTSIANWAFGGCQQLTSVDIPDSVSSIGDYAFLNCDGLTSITIPDRVSSIGNYAFLNCSGLTSIFIPKGMETIGENAFCNCGGLVSLAVAEDNPVYHSDGNCIIQTSTNTLVVGCKTSKIPAHVSAIGKCAFDGCNWLTSIDIPDSVSSIGDFAFADCRELTSIAIPTSVTTIGNWAFAGCAGLKEILYAGTKAQWEAIDKGLWWAECTGEYTIHCIDGDISN